MLGYRVKAALYKNCVGSSNLFLKWLVLLLTWSQYQYCNVVALL